MLPACWEVRKCGREKGGSEVGHVGVCPAYPAHGHSCWTVADTFCPGPIQGTCAGQMEYCTTCDVFRLYEPETGTDRATFSKDCPSEYARCTRAMQTDQFMELRSLMTRQD